MSRERQKISFEGLLQETVLGTLKLVRSLYDIRDRFKKELNAWFENA